MSGSAREGDGPGVVTALRVCGPAGDRLRVSIDGRVFATIDALRAHELGLSVGRAIDADQRAALAFEHQKVRGREIALRALATRARSREELRRRLLSRGIGAPAGDEVIAALTASGLLDDEAFARSMVSRERSRRPAGARLLEHKLREAGVDRSVSRRVVGEALSGVDPLEDALNLVRYHLRRIDPGAWMRPGEGQRIVRRLSGLLARRGFDVETAARAIDLARREHAELPDDQGFHESRLTHADEEHPP